ncbi:hypothetical protein EV693_10352 [Nicoletella semolina]|uniref:RiboL-PSP-HEPN domain-containing protein n=1 Tax=Nicoletella semolina TaxID=271160 RepID=A0A4R2NAL3_9PAST|nr:MAE_28990/MAE_18760 family HEPN-like nuclease [Nicoletella semolina]MDH2923964.1 hypothetical protein [Nicoletella semolina]TCP18087.1 hypothetical protein EV693_10352 [Nicoletella semolina]
MFSSIKTEHSTKQLEIQAFFAQIKQLNNEQNECVVTRQVFTKELLFNTLKGMLFVLLYGSIEYTVSETVKIAEREISLQNLHLNEVQPSLLIRFLHKNFDALHNVGRKYKWQKRLDFMQIFSSNSKIIENICDDLELPTDGKNIRVEQLRSIFCTFNIEPTLLNAQWGGRLKDIVENRNTIAHGNTTAADVGKNLFISDLQVRIDEVNAFCTTFIALFEDYLNNKKYKV